MVLSRWTRLCRKLNSRFYWGVDPWFHGLDRVKQEIEYVKPTVLSVLPHDKTSWTQGLCCCGRFIFESSGLYGRSGLRKMDQNGKILSQVSLGDGFAEGIALCGSELLQLTWREEKAIRYSAETMERLGVLSYGGEGWGLAKHPAGFIMSDGSDRLVERDSRFETVRTTRVRLAGRPVGLLNDLEWVGDKLYANVLGADFLLEIEYPKGIVSRIVDCSELREREGYSGKDRVMNGVAYCLEEDAFYLTGKNWQALFRVKIQRPAS